MKDSLVIGGRSFSSRLFAGTGKFSSGETMGACLAASGTELVTVALKRVRLDAEEDAILSHLNEERYQLMPNTSGARTAEEAVLAARLGREALATNWVKVEIHPDPKYLMPDPVETLRACEELAKDDFIVLPYVHADPVLCKRLEEVGVAAVMPLGSPIGSNRGLKAKTFLEIIIEQSALPVVVDAGIGSPSHAAEAMEMGADAVLVNTALAVAKDPVRMGEAFRKAVEAGRTARLAGLGAALGRAEPSSPLTAFLQED
ncbi:MAG: thiazole synthase [Opitutae bacterium]|nr:thiazole synthase [Opitutae bacterium]